MEIKYQVKDAADLERRLRERFGSAGFSGPVMESDTFFQHPCRDFVQTDECLRLRERRLSEGAFEHTLTYKGPRIDTSTKTRLETEMPITEPEQWESLLTALGFRRWASVQKFRRRMPLVVDGRHVEIVLDTLPALPEPCRLFAEMETLAGESELDECRSLILGIAGQLALGEPIRDSYLKLVLAQSTKPVA